MAVVFLEPGTAATQGFQFFTSTTASNGTITSDAQAVGGSVRSIKCTGTTSSGRVFATKNGVLADAGRRISFYYRTDALPTVNNNRIFRNGSAGNWRLDVTPSGNLELSIGSSPSTGSFVLAINTDYQITISYVIVDSTHQTFKVFINGVIEISAVDLSTITTGITNIEIGRNILASTIGSGSDYFAHIYIDDDPSVSHTGNIKVTAKRPFANGSINGFTTQIGSGNSGYGSGHADEVNERPLSTINGWSMIGSGGAVTEEYSIESASAGDVDIASINIRDIVGWVYASALVSITAQIKVDGVLSNISLTSTNTLFTKVTGVRTYPAGDTDIGIITDTTLTTVSLYEAGILVAYDDLVFNTPRENAKYTHFWGGR